MNALLIYAGAVFLIALLSLVVIYNFIRYRFTGDRTFVFLTLFGVLFAGSIAFTLLEYGQSGNASAATITFQ
jgi:uncharacterized membrane protein